MLCTWLLAVPMTATSTLIQAQKEPPRYQTVKASRDGTGKMYMGREIAGVMGWQGASWLERGERQQEERGDLLLR